MRVIFMGTAPFACPTLSALVAASHEVVAVVTQPDRPRGRGRRPAASAVKTLALKHHLNLLQPASLRPLAVTEELAGYRPDVIVVVAYGNILPPPVLALPPYGCINLHGSLLPKYRGPAPINWTLINGETEAGYTIIQMDEHVDTGPMLWMASSHIEPNDDAVTLGDRLALLGAQGMILTLAELERGNLVPRPQPPEGVSYAPKLSRQVGCVDWQQEATAIHNLIRGTVPWPGATAVFREMTVKLWRTAVETCPSCAPPGTVVTVSRDGMDVACGKDQLRLRELQPANRRRMTAHDFVQGYRVAPGDRFA